MSEVLTLPTALRSDAGHVPHPATPNPVAELVSAFDKALGNGWSFDIVHHETVDNETVVFVKLAVDGRYRIGIGGTTATGSLVHRLNAAAVDALVRAAEWMGIAKVVASSTQSQPEPVPVSPAEAGARITRKQLDYAISLARDRGIARDKLAARCLAEFGKKAEYLTRTEASALIEALRKEAA